MVHTELGDLKVQSAEVSCVICQWTQTLIIGRHRYFNIKLIVSVHLEDYCDRGQGFNFWEDPLILDASNGKEAYKDDPELSWVNFVGRWGNDQKIVSILTLLNT